MQRGPMHVQQDEVQTSSRWSGVKVRIGEEQLRFHTRRWTMVQNFEESGNSDSEERQHDYHGKKWVVIATVKV
ncbi:hypothetical protein TNCV_3120351 [Trichonephila clavipes]|uniref:Uncharacterized protein n=1 Tax=Trichonephila clavipes TaxID=2585209 RepID=A0A8X6W9Q0_TRICX|nr:hypothetical protein TNCV_3120351 [Trichonephila clavipes]